MFRNLRKIRIGIALYLITAVIWMPLASSGQDLVPISSITGGSSVFVFRNNARAARRTIASSKPKRSRSERLETAARVRNQYDTLAKSSARRVKADVVDPAQALSKALAPEQGATRFAGVGEFYIEKGDLDQAFSAFREALRLDETNEAAKTGFSEALAAKGSELLLKEQAGTAKAMFLEALKYNPKNSAAYFGLGEAYADLDQISEAVANYETALQGDPELTEIFVPLGILYYQSGEIAKADDLLTKALANADVRAETQFFLGLVRTSQNRNEEALAAFQKAKTLDPTNDEAFFNSAETLVRLKRASEAIPDYQKAIEINSKYFEAWFGLGEAFNSLERYPEAVDAYKAASKLRNNSWEVFAGLGEAYRQTRQFELAEANYNLGALFLTGTDGFDKDAAADLYSKVGHVIGQQCDINVQKSIVCNWSSAIRALKKAVDLTDNPIDVVNLGWAYFRAGHHEAENKNMPAARPFLELAEVTLQKAVDAGPPASGFALQNLASVQIDLGNNKGAIATLLRLLEQRPNIDFARYAIGVAYFKDNDFLNAEKWFRLAIEKDPKNVSYLMALGRALIGRKDSKGLKVLIEQLRVIDPRSADELDKTRIAFRL